MKYYFILGSNPTLSVAEIAARFSAYKKLIMPQNNVLLADLEHLPDKIINELGGVIKIGKIFAGLDIKDGKFKIVNKLHEYLMKEPGEKKIKFGISFYGKSNFREKAVGLELKNKLKEDGLSSRYVTSQEKVLSSVVVGQNKLIESGAEFVFIQNGNELLIGITEMIQPYKELSSRDYGRPARDDLSGMLPPKLAQIMINLSSTEKTAAILDPFCGSGTILSEAILMGYDNFIGSDISVKAIEDTKKNIEWTVSNYKLSPQMRDKQNKNYKLYNYSATELSRYIKPNSIVAIITEPYLGPQRGNFETDKIKRELEGLYNKSLIEFTKILKANGRIVMIWPVFRVRKNLVFLNPVHSNLKIIDPIPPELKRSKFISLTKRQTIIYGRPNQNVWREIVVLKKK